MTDMATITTTLRAQYKRLQALLLETKEKGLSDLNATLKDKTGDLWNTTRDQLNIVPYDQTTARVAEIKRQLDEFENRLQQESAPTASLPVVRPAIPALIQAPPSKAKEQVPTSKPAVTASDDDLAELLRRLAAFDRRLESIDNGVEALKDGLLTTSQKELLVNLVRILGDPESLKALETVIGVGKWANNKRRPREDRQEDARQALLSRIRRV